MSSHPTGLNVPSVPEMDLETGPKSYRNLNNAM